MNANKMIDCQSNGYQIDSDAVLEYLGQLKIQDQLNGLEDLSQVYPINGTSAHAELFIASTLPVIDGISGNPSVKAVNQIYDMRINIQRQRLIASGDYFDQGDIKTVFDENKGHTENIFQLRMIA